MTKNITINYDAFSEGQVASKIWLCEQLESISITPAPKIWILGGWYGIQAFLLLSRGKMKINHIRSFDVDPLCEFIADRINAMWVVDEWKFKAVTQDANKLVYEKDVDVVINTSTEHFESNEWFDNIPEGTLVCLQGNNMNHDGHTSDVASLAEFIAKYPLQRTVIDGEMGFEYPDWNFARYMLIGFK